VGNPAAISTGPGTLRIAQIGSAEPADLITPWPAAWTQLGYTKKGTAYSHKPNVAKIEVAEEVYPIGVVNEAMESMVKFQLAENTATNMKRALNGGTIVTGSGFVYYEPPAPGAEVYVMLGFESQDGQERVVYRQCFQMGSIDTDRQKGADYATIPCEFQLIKPAGLQPWRHYFKSPDRA
jgi:hypothetical protein